VGQSGRSLVSVPATVLAGKLRGQGRGDLGRHVAEYPHGIGKDFVQRVAKSGDQGFKGSVTGWGYVLARHQHPDSGGIEWILGLGLKPDGHARREHAKDAAGRGKKIRPC